MKKLTVRKDKECMACLACVQACSEAFYKVMDPGKSCIQIVEKNGVVKPSVCVQCGKCAKACEAGAITQNAKGVYMINKKTLYRLRQMCGGLSVPCNGESRRFTGNEQVYRMRYMCKSLSDGCTGSRREINRRYRIKGAVLM